jgi:hypothetical protein
MGCLLPTLAIAAATVACLRVLPLAAGLGLAAGAAALIGHRRGPYHWGIPDRHVRPVPKGTRRLDQGQGCARTVALV